MKISEIYGKKVESTAGKKGYVLSVCANGKEIECLVCADENEKEFTVDVKNILSIDERIVFEDSESGINSGLPIRLGKPVYDREGNFLGMLTDFSFEKNRLNYAYVGRKKFSADDLVCGDAIIVKYVRILKSDVKKNGRVIIRRGTCLTPEVLEKAQTQGEYVQTNLKSI